MREARRAGTKHASAATARSMSETIGRNRDVVRPEAVEQRGHQARGDGRQTTPMASPANVNAMPRRPKESRMSRDVAPNAMRTPISFGALRHGVGKHAVQSDRREQQREQRERAQERGVLRRRRQLPGDDASNV